MADEENAVDYIIIRCYFDHGHWKRLSPYEKLRFFNIFQNYEAMTKAGLKVPRPSFMDSRKTTSVSSASRRKVRDEDDWLPSGAPIKKRKEHRDVSSISDEPASMRKSLRLAKRVVNIPEDFPEDEESKVCRYNLRRTAAGGYLKRISYQEPSEWTE